MDRDQPPPTRRKYKFTPRGRPNRRPRPVPTSTEAGDEQSEEIALSRNLLRRGSDILAKREPKEAERKSSAQVAFGPQADSSPSLRIYGVRRGESNSSVFKDFADEQNALTRSSTAIEDQSDTDDSEYEEPYDYNNTYYPTVLPLRKPYSGNPEKLDEEEFGEAATNKEYDENIVNPAEELGFMEKSEKQKMLLFQLPVLPSVSRKGKEKVGTSRTVSRESPKGISLEDLPRGCMGKLLVHRSGAIKLKLGEIQFDVSPGTNAIHAQRVVAINVAQENCCVLGQPDKTAVIIPDIDSIEL